MKKNIQKTDVSTITHHQNYSNPEPELKDIQTTSVLFNLSKEIFYINFKAVFVISFFYIISSFTPLVKN